MASTLLTKMLLGHRLIHPSSFLTHQPQILSSLFSVSFTFSVRNFFWVSLFTLQFVCVCVCVFFFFLNPVLISPLWDWTCGACESLVFVWFFGCFDLWVSGLCFFLIKVLTFECGNWGMCWFKFFCFSVLLVFFVDPVGWYTCMICFSGKFPWHMFHTSIFQCLVLK